MQNRKFHVVASALLIAALLTTSLSAAALAATVETPRAASAQTVASSLTGTLPGGEFSKAWLGYTPETPNTDVTIKIEWNTDAPGSNGLHFYVLDANGLNTVVAGGSLLDNNIASGSPIFEGPGNQEYASFHAGTDPYTVVVANDSMNDGTFTISSEHGTFSDDSGQTTDPNAADTTETPVAETDGITTTVGTTEGTTDVAAEATPEVTAEPVTVSTTVTETTTTTDTAAAPEVTPEATVVSSAASSVVRATTLQGSLPEQDDQHYIGLEPDSRDAEISLLLTYDPQDSSELARRLNFWVLDATGLQRYIEGTNASDVAIAAGSRTFTGDSNERVATFTAAGSGPYTVIVYNNSQVPATYSLTATGGMLVDDSMQTTTAQAAAAAGGTGVSSSTTSTTTTTTTTTVPVTTTGTTTTAPAASTGVEGEPGGTYTVQSGDTLAIIARDVYGDYTVYSAICAYNNISDCNRIEVGQTINLPTTEQIASNATATPSTAAPATTATPAAAVTEAPTVDATDEVTGTTATTGTVAATPAPTVAATAAATTAAALPTATKAATTGSSTTAGSDIIAELEDNGNFTMLLQALDVAGLTDQLSGSGNFTLFAPTDSAFQALGLADYNALLRDSAIVESLVKFHIANEEVMTDGITNGESLMTLQGTPVEFTVEGASTKVQDSNIIVPDLSASNGVIQIIDKVMLPPQ